MPGRHVMGGAGGSGGGGGGAYSESAALVRSTEGMSYTEEGRPPPGSGSAGGGGGTPHDGGEDELMDYVDSDVSVLAQFHEDAIRQVSHSLPTIPPHFSPLTVCLGAYISSISTSAYFLLFFPLRPHFLYY